MVKGRGGARKREPSLSDDDMFGFDDDDNPFDDGDKKKIIPENEEVFGFGDSDDLGDDDDDDEDQDGKSDENDDIDMGSDIEEEDDGLPDDRAWGKSKRRFYNTDYVDQDFEGFYEGKEAEEAELEEQEARNIQKRLIEQLNEADFVIAAPIGTATKTVTDVDAFEEIERDVSKLSKRQKLDLLQKESPEFMVLVQDFKNKLVHIDQKLMPVLSYYENKKDSSPAVQFLKKKFLILINYCTNISFYLLLKAKGIPVSNHPVLKSLFRYRKLLEQIQEIDAVMEPQIERLLESLKSDGKAMLDEESCNVLKSKKKKEKNILKLLSKKKTKKTDREVGDEGQKKEMKADDGGDLSGAGDSDEVNEEVEDQAETKERDEKRAITYEMAKNKGLMPKRNKDQRNPRVKHRKKYRKALIRRKGQVRIARSEIPVYGGELTGIKANVTKSIKFK